MKSDELFDKLADKRGDDAEARVSGEAIIYDMPSVDDLRDLWNAQNKKLGDIKKLKEADFVIKKSNEFYFTSMYLKAALLQDCDRRTALLSGITQDYNMGHPKSFIRNEYKELKKRLNQ